MTSSDPSACQFSISPLSIYSCIILLTIYASLYQLTNSQLAILPHFLQLPVDFLNIYKDFHGHISYYRFPSGHFMTKQLLHHTNAFTSHAGNVISDLSLLTTLSLHHVEMLANLHPYTLLSGPIPECSFSA